MFLRIGSSYLNTAQIKRIRPFTKKEDAGCHVEIEMVDGTIMEGLCDQDRIAALTRHYLPAAPGIEISTWALDPNNFEPLPELQKEILVGFAYEGVNEIDLCPVTVESGVIEGAYNLKLQDGTVRASWGETYKSEAEMLAAARVRFKKAA